MVAMIGRMQRHVTDCCGTAVIYKKPSLELFDVTMPPSSFGLTPTAMLFGHTRSIPRDFRQRVVNELAQHSKRHRMGFEPSTSRLRDV